MYTTTTLITPKSNELLALSARLSLSVIVAGMLVPLISILLTTYARNIPNLLGDVSRLMDNIRTLIIKEMEIINIFRMLSLALAIIGLTQG